MQPQQKQDDNADLQLATCRGGKGKRLNSKSKLALAIRRNMSNIASSDIGSVLLIDISHQSINRYEVDLAAALTAASRGFYNRCEEELLAASSNVSSHWQFVVHCARSDATNSGVWQRSKLQVADVFSMYIGDDGWADSHHCWTELQRVTDGTAVCHTLHFIRCSGFKLTCCSLLHIRFPRVPTCARARACTRVRVHVNLKSAYLHYISTRARACLCYVLDHRRSHQAKPIQTPT
jgi:hypothetical protein